jgi:hypothetical protein
VPDPPNVMPIPSDRDFVSSNARPIRNVPVLPPFVVFANHPSCDGLKARSRILKLRVVSCLAAYGPKEMKKTTGLIFSGAQGATSDEE